MANTVPSPNMNMPVPVVSVDPGPDWATNIDACLSILDSHNHTPGQGVAITPAAININTDLPMNNNNLITARSVRFAPQGSSLTQPADLGILYELGVDLYYVDGSGNQIRLTQAGSPAGATGTITGLPSGTASASFAGSTFTFQSATNTPAILNVGPIIIGQPMPGGKNVTISDSGSQAANYNLTLPVALPSAQSNLTSDASGNLSFVLSGPNYRPAEGSVIVTLTAADSMRQVFDVTGGSVLDLRMPSTGVLAGDQWVIENRGSGEVRASASNAAFISATTQAPSGNGDAQIGPGYMILEAAANTPATPTDWRVVEVFERFNASGVTIGTVVNFSLFLYRSQRTMTANISSDTTGGSGNFIALPAATVPSRFITPAIELWSSTVIYDNGGKVGGIAIIDPDGSISFTRYDSAAFSGTTGITSVATNQASFTWVLR